MIYLNTGNLWTKTYLDKVIELNKTNCGIKVGALFGSIANLTPTARAFDRIPSRTEDFIAEYVAKAQDNNIAIRYTLNQSCLGPLQDFKTSFDDTLKNRLHWFHSIGIHEWTISSPLLIEIIKNMFPNDFVEVSTIVEISTLLDAERWAALGANGANVSTNINRDFNRLRAMSKVFEISILCNEACLYRCPWRRECYNLSSHNSRRSEELFGYYPFRRCNEIRIKHPEEWLRSRMVLPQWLDIYHEQTKVDWYKIAYRTHPEEVAIPMLEAYMNARFDGNLCALWPTIAKLGNTPEPKDITNIPCDRLETADFLGHWFSGDTCPNLSCDVTCFYCSTIYSAIKK